MIHSRWDIQCGQSFKIRIGKMSKFFYGGKSSLSRW